MPFKEKLLYIAILLFLTTLYQPWLPVVNIIAVAFLLISAITFSSFKEKGQLLKERKHLLGMLLFFAVILISVGLSKNVDKALRYLDPRLPLLFFPLCLGTLYLSKTFKEKVLVGFAVLTTFMCVLCLGWGIYRSGFFQHPEVLYNDSLTEILHQQSIYIALLVNLAIYTFA
jgi:O-antigen ligase